jgi:hypothetical protein
MYRSKSVTLALDTANIKHFRWAAVNRPVLSCGCHSAGSILLPQLLMIYCDPPVIPVSPPGHASAAASQYIMSASNWPRSGLDCLAPMCGWIFDDLDACARIFEHFLQTSVRVTDCSQVSLTRWCRVTRVHGFSTWLMASTILIVCGLRSSDLPMYSVSTPELMDTIDFCSMDGCSSSGA